MRRKILHFLFFEKLTWVDSLLIIIGLMTVYCIGIDSVPFHPDETYWVDMAARLSQPFNSPSWQPGYMTYEVRPFPGYLAALGQKLAGISLDELPQAAWDWSLSTAENTARGAVPSAQVLLASRFPMAILAALALALTAIGLGRGFGRFYGYFFAWASCNSYFLTQLRRAMCEAPLLFFSVLLLCALPPLLDALHEKQKKRVILWSILVGVLSGLAAECKLTGALGVGLAIIAGFVSIYFKQDQKDQRVVRLFQFSTLLILASALISFVAVYPFFYVDPLTRMLGTLATRQNVLQTQLHDYPAQVISFWQRPVLLVKRIFGLPLGWPTSVSLGGYILPLFFLGVGIYETYAQSQFFPRGLVLVSAAVVLGLPMCFTPLDWDRYYLWPVFFACIFLSIGASRLILELVNPRIDKPRL
jgi:hypothetical protein